GPDLLTRFEREARTAAKLRHPHIVPVLDVGQTADHAYLVMAFVEGQSLAERLLAAGRLDETAATDIAWQIADALHYAHEQNVVHRDVKPANILLTAGGRARLTDFGVALALDDPVLTRTGFIVGTPAYIAPEQAGGQRPVDGRADIYALGVVLYQMVTGQIPFQGTTPEVLHAHVYTPPPSPLQWVKISRALERVIMQALAKNPKRRFQSGRDMAEALAKLGPLPATQSFVLAVETRTQPGLSLDPDRAGQTAAHTTPHLPQSARLSENPFFYGGAVSPDRFYGRQSLLQTIVRRVQARTPQSVSIVGERRMGKSSLLTFFKHYADHHFPETAVIVYLDLMKAYSRTRSGLMKALRRALTPLWREPWSPAEDGDLMAFDFALEELLADGRRLLLCLDEVENLTERAAEFNDVLEDWRACAQLGQMAIVTASALPLADLCALGGLTSPFYNIFSQHRLGLFSTGTWQALVTENMAVSPGDLTFIETVAGGHPFFTQMAASYLWEAQQGGTVDYDRLWQELWFQGQAHLDHLWRSLTAEEQTIMRRLATDQPPASSAAQTRIVAGLARRGIVRNEQPFSEFFAEMIRNA
ncbi:MAG: serine/threonine-protein kinase, partial [Anaerolineae bacterium]|nr:serine/threonine-protein kinase [Anaerolineae bacterium]